MGINVTMMFEREVTGVLHRCVEGCDLAKGKTVETLGRIAQETGVRPIDDFYRDTLLEHLPEEARVAMTLGCWSEEEWGPRPDDPEPNWYDPAEGLASLRALLGHLRGHPRAIRRGVDELEEMERALAAAAAEGVRFHVYFDV
ncbi:hypothetical protein [Paludisphaera soli]|uniref:hypothetical protein n=1 Tax=Paludisphaera soli TaxID=2712865 RepID=UPI0013EA5A0A|nr:hypothetical protein [Paludisphaera soli]